MKKVLVLLLITAFAICCAFAQGNNESATQTSSAGNAESDTWTPTKAITWIVPYEAGGNSDVQARVMAKYMSKYSDKPVEIMNINGASGRMGAQEAMKATPDGYTYLMQPGSYPLGYAIGTAKFSYEDFDMVTLWVDSSLAVVVNSKSGWTSIQDLIDAAKANPGQIKMGMRSGTTALFASLYLQQAAGVEFNLVDLSEAKAPELLSQRIDCYIDGIGAVKQYVMSGDFNCLGLLSDVKAPGLDEIPTFKELGFTGYEYLKQSYGIWAPKGTPKAAIEYVNNLVKLASQDPDCIVEMNNLGVSPTYKTVEEYTEHMRNTYANYQKAAASLN